MAAGGNGNRDREQEEQGEQQGSIHNDNMTCKSFVKAADGDKQCTNREKERGRETCVSQKDELEVGG